MNLIQSAKPNGRTEGVKKLLNSKLGKKEVVLAFNLSQSNMEIKPLSDFSCAEMIMSVMLPSMFLHDACNSVHGSQNSKKGKQLVLISALFSRHVVLLPYI